MMLMILFKPASNPSRDRRAALARRDSITHRPYKNQWVNPKTRTLASRFAPATQGRYICAATQIVLR